MYLYPCTCTYFLQILTPGSLIVSPQKFLYLHIHALHSYLLQIPAAVFVFVSPALCMASDPLAWWAAGQQLPLLLSCHHHYLCHCHPHHYHCQCHHHHYLCHRHHHHYACHHFHHPICRHHQHHACQRCHHVIIIIFVIVIIVIFVIIIIVFVNAIIIIIGVIMLAVIFTILFVVIISIMLVSVVIMKFQDA